MSDYLRLVGIRKQFGTFQALHDIDLSIPSGEFVCFLGPSGCGKTTLLRIVAGLEMQSAGGVFQSGRDVSRLPPAQRDYGIVFQSYALFPNLSVGANIAYGLVNQRRARAAVNARVSELLALVGLPDSAAKYPAQLSGGQQQRVALARALAIQPGLLLLDEPLSALDALERVRLRQEIRALQRQLGVTTIMVTHDQEEALAVADRIVVMNRGRIEQVGTPMQIYREPATPFVADFVGKVNVLVGRLCPGGSIQIGRRRFDTSIHTDAPRDVKVYLRPDDVLARRQDASDINVDDAEIEKVEFLGSHCHVSVRCADLGAQSVLVHLSLNYLLDQDLRAGSRIALRILSERMRAF